MFALLGHRRLTLPVSMMTMCFFEKTLNSRLLIAVRNDPEDAEALTPNHFLLGWPMMADPMMHDSVRCVNCRKMYKVAQA